MAFLNSNIPIIRAKVLKSYLDGTFDEKHEALDCLIVNIKSIPGRSFQFSAWIPKYSALYDKLPIAAFRWKDTIQQIAHLPQHELQLWDCFSYYINVHVIDFIKGSSTFVQFNDDKRLSGEYLFTVDSCAGNTNDILNTGLSEDHPEHKSFNFIKLDNGQFTMQPNNRCRFIDASMSERDGLNQRPPFKAMTRVFSSEREHGFVLGDDESFHYSIPSDNDGGDITGDNEFRILENPAGRSELIYESCAKYHQGVIHAFVKHTIALYGMRNHFDLDEVEHNVTQFILQQPNWFKSYKDFIEHNTTNNENRHSFFALQSDTRLPTDRRTSLDTRSIVNVFFFEWEKEVLFDIIVEALQENKYIREDSSARDIVSRFLYSDELISNLIN